MGDKDKTLGIFNQDLLQFFQKFDTHSPLSPSLSLSLPLSHTRTHTLSHTLASWKDNGGWWEGPWLWKCITHTWSMVYKRMKYIFLFTEGNDEENGLKNKTNYLTWYLRLKSESWIKTKLSFIFTLEMSLHIV